MQRLIRLLEVDKKDIYQVYTYALLNGLVNLSLPLGIQAIINLIQGGEVSTAWIVLVSIVIIGIALTGVFQLMQLRIVENVAQRVFTRSSFEFAYRFPHIRFDELYRFYAPELANRFFDTLTIQKGLPKVLIDFSLAIFQIIFGLIVLSMYHPFFVVFGVLLVALVYIILAFTGPRGVRTSLMESKYKYNVAHWLEEIARTKLSFKLTADSHVSMSMTDQKVNKYLHARESHFKILVQQFLQLIGFKLLIAAGLLIIGGLLVFQQQMNIGQFVAAEIIILLIITSVEKLIQSLDSVYDVLTALEKIGAVTDMELDNDSGICFAEDIDGIEIDLNNLSYAFPGGQDMILKNIDFQIPKNTSVVITGHPGSGKSTLMQILSGISEPSSGILRFNGQSFASLNTVSLRSHIGYAITNNHIFSGTLYDNIVMGRAEVSSIDLDEAIRITKLDGFIRNLHNGLLTEMDPEGSHIPRSAVNKIILARAIVSKPKMLLLEDPLDHVPLDEKEFIIGELTSPKNKWAIVVTTVDPIWTNYIPNHVIINKGQIESVTY